MVYLKDSIYKSSSNGRWRDRRVECGIEAVRGVRVTAEHQLAPKHFVGCLNADVCQPRRVLKEARRVGGLSSMVPPSAD